MSSPQNPQNPNPYADPVQAQIPGQAPWTGGQQDQQDQQGQQYQQGPGGNQRRAVTPRQAATARRAATRSARPLSYLQGAPVGFADAVAAAFTHPLTLRGRASRSAFGGSSCSRSSPTRS